MLERSTKVGGTWANGRYPGLCCDTASLLYSFTFEQKVDWTRTCARQPEIRQYMQHCVDKYGLGPHIRFNSELREARWDEDGARWVLPDDRRLDDELGRADQRARYVQPAPVRITSAVSRTSAARSSTPATGPRAASMSAGRTLP